MPLPGTRAARVLAALACFLAVESAALAGGTLLRDRQRGTSVVVIGSGRSPSVLVTAGEARLLIAAGDDPTAFGNGWRRWSGPVPTARVDVLLLAGGDAGTVAATVLEGLAPRWVGTIGTLEPGVLGGRRAPPLDPPRRFRLSADLAVTVERGPARADEAGGLDRWRVVIERGRTVVAVVPDGAAAASFAWPAPVAALVVLRGGVADAVAAVEPGALVVPQLVAGRTLRSEVAPVLDRRLWTVRVPPGEIARLEFVDSGLRVPDDATVLTPAPAAGTPAWAGGRLR